MMMHRGKRGPASKHVINQNVSYVGVDRPIKNRLPQEAFKSLQRGPADSCNLMDLVAYTAAEFSSDGYCQLVGQSI